jgi:hypothetical protein
MATLYIRIRKSWWVKPYFYAVIIAMMCGIRVDIDRHSRRLARGYRCEVA